jgi:CheY-like chemotaxis protein/predicted regulator of Ras-like GTPase activity (Roadblock/LC7/MglB family)
VVAKRILVVDDEPNVVKSCARILELEGFEVQTASGGIEALALYKSENFDLALVDLRMPDMSGLEVLAALKEYDPNATAAIFTAYGTKENAIEALRLGAREFLEKPLDAKVVVATVRQILERKEGTAVRGNLHSLSLPNIIQINCTERNQARLRLWRRQREGHIFFAAGNVVHAVLGAQVGEEAVYELLAWEGGEFELEMDVPPPERTITANWSGLLLEGMRRIDESTVEWDVLGELEEETTTSEAPREEVVAAAPGAYLAQPLEDLRCDVGARCAFLADMQGRPLVETGESGRLDVVTLLSLLAGSFAASAELARHFGDGQALNINFHRGSRYEIHSASVGDDLFLALVFDRQIQVSSIGIVWLYTRRAVGSISATVESAVPGRSPGADFDNPLMAEMMAKIDAFFPDSSRAKKNRTD